MACANYNGVLTREEFLNRIKMWCFEKDDKLTNVASDIGVCNAYFYGLGFIGDYDIRKVAKHFGITKQEFVEREPYELLKLPDVWLKSCDYTDAEWAVISKAIKEAKNGR